MRYNKYYNIEARENLWHGREVQREVQRLTCLHAIFMPSCLQGQALTPHTCDPDNLILILEYNTVLD